MTRHSAQQPVIVGVGETVCRPGENPRAPLELMTDAARAAERDAGTGGLLERIETIGAIPSASWMDGDPGRALAGELGLEVPTIRPSMQGGNGPQLLLGVLAERIARGELGAALIAGAEALSTVARLARAGESPPWPDPDPDRQPDDVLEADELPNTERETAVAMIAPVMTYPMIENALRFAAGRSTAEHLQRIAELWAGFSTVAAEQDAAWTPRAYTAEQLRTASQDNRQVTFPYTKLMNANIQVDQGCALILTTVELARELGVPERRWIFPWAAASATDEWFVSHRRQLSRSPAIEACGQALYAHAGIGPEDLGPVDLYSCFPAAVQLGAAALGLPLDDPRRLTCTGGLTFFGGPGNNYSSHGIAAVVRRLRGASAGTLGLASAMGWYATKHAVGLYGNQPPPHPFELLRPTPAAVEPREVLAPGDHQATAETCTLVYERDGTPAYGILFALEQEGRRLLAQTTDPGLMAQMTRDDFLGAPVRMLANGSFTR